MKNKAFSISVIILSATAIMATYLSFRGEPAVVATNLERLPLRILEYKGYEDGFSDAVNAELNADFSLFRHYINDKGKKIDLYVGYYGTAKGGRTPHNPYACFSSAGWSVIESHPVKISKDGNFSDTSLNYMLVKKGELLEGVLHWYQSGGDMILYTGLQQNYQRFIGRVIHNRNDGAFIRLSLNGSDTEKSKTLLLEFAKKLIPLLSNNWPEEK